MTEILMTPQAGAAPTLASSRGAESGANEAPRADTETSPLVPFAAVLKSKSEKQPTDTGKEVPSATEPPTTIDDVSDLPTVAAPDLLSMLVTERPRDANAEQATLASTTASTGLGQLDALAMVAPASPSTQSISPTGAREALDALRHSAGTPANFEGAVTPTPTFLMAETPDSNYNSSLQRVDPAVSLAIETNPAPDKLAVEAAIAATSAKPGTGSTGSDLNAEEFRAVIDRAPCNPATIGIQGNGTVAPLVPTTDLRVATPMGQSGWRDEVGQKLTWMASNGRQQAELILNPPQLGRIEVMLTLNEDQASVSFTSPHAAVRETLESSMGRLREMLADAGVTLGQTHVGADSGNYPNPMLQNNDRQASTRSAGTGHATTVGLPGGESAWRATAGRGMVDVFA